MSLNSAMTFYECSFGKNNYLFFQNNQTSKLKPQKKQFINQIQFYLHFHECSPSHSIDGQVTTDLRNKCGVHTGTSSSAAMASGICALALQAKWVLVVKMVLKCWCC